MIRRENDLNTYFPEIKKNLGFGFMRLPMIEDKVDIEHTQKMVDLFMQRGFNYFDTAHSYINGQSEKVLKECLTSKYPRESYVLADKLSAWNFDKEEDIIPLFESQLEICGVDYFDFYLMHSQNKEHYAKYKRTNAYKTALNLKAEGKIKHFGISFHDTAEVLEQILTENPEIEFVQIQFNYIDYDSDSVQSRKVYEVCRKYNKPVIVMEPVKGGLLSNLSDDCLDIFKPFGDSAASFAIRFAAGFEGVFMVLSGMSNLDMIDENTGFMCNFKPLDEQEAAAVQKVCEIIKGKEVIGCTSCEYCVEKCPASIAIPKMFSCLNTFNKFSNWNAEFYYSVHTKDRGKASDCVKCGACEKVCPQHLNIRDLLEVVAEKFERKDS